MSNEESRPGAAEEVGEEIGLLAATVAVNQVSGENGSADEETFSSNPIWPDVPGVFFPEPYTIDFSWTQGLPAEAVAQVNGDTPRVELGDDETTIEIDAKHSGPHTTIDQETAEDAAIEALEAESTLIDLRPDDEADAGDEAEASDPFSEPIELSEEVTVEVQVEAATDASAEGIDATAAEEAATDKAGTEETPDKDADETPIDDTAADVANEADVTDEGGLEEVERTPDGDTGEAAAKDGDGTTVDAAGGPSLEAVDEDRNDTHVEASEDTDGAAEEASGEEVKSSTLPPMMRPPSEASTDDDDDMKIEIVGMPSSDPAQRSARSGGAEVGELAAAANLAGFALDDTAPIELVEEDRRSATPPPTPKARPKAAPPTPRAAVKRKAPPQIPNKRPKAPPLPVDATGPTSGVAEIRAADDAKTLPLLKRRASRRLRGPKPTMVQPSLTGGDYLFGTGSRDEQFTKSGPWYETIFDESYYDCLPDNLHKLTRKESAFADNALRLQEGAMVLDLACGFGRHAMELAKRGYIVIGVDKSDALVAKARQEAERRGLGVDIRKGDMRDLSFDALFDGAIIMGVSFGYFDDRTNFKVLENIRKALKLKGRLLLELLNRDRITRELPKVVWWRGQDCLILEEVEFNYETSRLASKRTVVFDDGRPPWEQFIEIRLYSLHEIYTLLESTGFRVAEVSGSIHYPGVFFVTRSRQLLLVAEAV